MSKQVQVPKLLTVETHSACCTVNANASAVAVDYFGPDHGNGASASIHNDLPEGILPNNAAGELVGVMVRDQTSVAGSSAGGDNAVKDLHTLRSLFLQVFINHREHMQIPVFLAPHPPMWVQGALTEVAATDRSNVIAENAGYQTYQINQTIQPRQRVGVRLVSKAPVTINNARDVQIILQVAQRTVL